MIDNKSHEKGRSTNLTLNSRDKKQKKNPPQRQDGVGSLPYSQFSAANFVRNLLVGSILPLAVVAAGVGSGCQVVPAAAAYTCPGSVWGAQVRVGSVRVPGGMSAKCSKQNVLFPSPRQSYPRP